MQKRKGRRVALALSDSFFIQVDDVTVGIEDDGMDVSGANADPRLSALCRQVPSAVHKPASPPHWRRTRTFLMAHYIPRAASLRIQRRISPRCWRREIDFVLSGKR